MNLTCIFIVTIFLLFLYSSLFITSSLRFLPSHIYLSFGGCRKSIVSFGDRNVIILYSLFQKRVHRNSLPIDTVSTKSTGPVRLNPHKTVIPE